MIGMRIKDAFAQKGFELDWNGHWRDGEDTKKFYRQDFKNDMISIPMLFWEPSLEEAQKLLDAVESGEPLDDFIPLGRANHSLTCTHCGTDAHVETNGQVVRVVEPCPRPEGINDIEVELNVPSGQMVFENDLRPWFSIVGDFYVNENIGIEKTTKAYAEVGMAHGFVGNTCPSVFRNKDFKTVTVGNHNSRAERVGGICTDLWWYSAVDYDEFKRRIEARGGDTAVIDSCDVVGVKPGVYKVTHHLQNVSDEKRNKTFATFKWIRDPDPVADFEAAENAKDFTAGQIIAESIKNYPDLYAKDKTWDDMNEDERMHASARVADHLLLTIGNGCEWHKNGWTTSCPDLDPNLPDLEIPIFEGQMSWYDLSKGYSALCIAAGYESKSVCGDIPYMNPSFQRLAFNILQCIIRFGVKKREYGNDKHDDTPRVERMEREATEIFKKLAEKYEVPEDIAILVKEDFLDPPWEDTSSQVIEVGTDVT